jgi:N-acetylneuraminic acid mutarotase
LLLDFSKLVICGGLIKGGFPTDTCEVISLESSASPCKNLPNFPAPVYGAIGGLEVKGNFEICVGWQNYNQSGKCFSLDNNKWVLAGSRNSAKTSAASAQFQDGQLIVTGGQTSSLDNLNSVYMLTEEGWKSTIPSLPVTMVDHCMVTVNSTTVMVIGGWQNDEYSGKTFYFTFGEVSWTKGPKLKSAKFWHSCGKIRRNITSQELSIIVAGGSDGSSSYLSSVEILEV